MKVLMSAYPCSPGQGSEPGAGWAFVRAAATRHDVSLFTHPEYAAAISAAQAREPNLRLTVCYLNVSRPLARLAGGRVRAHSVDGYLAWQRRVTAAAAELHRRERFDVGHHVTLATDWLPAGIAWVPSLPVVWGPVGGATGTVARLWPQLGWRSAATEVARSVGSALARRVAGDATARRAALIVAQNPDVASRFSRFARLVVEPHVALLDSERPVDRAAVRRAGAQPRRALFVGRLVGWKGPRLAIAALAHPASEGWTLDLIGDGPDATGCETLIRRLGVGDRVRLRRGWVPRDEVLAELDRADGLLFPSLHDSAPWAVGEALAHGVPVVCLDRGGPAVLVGPGQGTKVPVGGDVVAALAAALAGLPGRFPAERRWNASRLPDLLDHWYTSVVDA